ncbi:Adenine deaminase (plasmid) [Phaeobacter inhibens]|uniref:adenosine deaminase family protein n=1 Tax=Phaeobacter inhibens TaxID=221822 RepID=UPI000C9B06B8|nr:adenosine deaminase [Phaeobacter inhibens]AUQ60711.1 Adenine deaminase [Phaeobacter inhibens]
MNELEAFLRKIPKAELHVHFTGALRREIFETLNRKYNANEHKAIDRAFDRTGYNNVLTALKTASRLLRKPEDIRDAVYEVQRDAADNSVRYREIFWNPTDHADLADLPYDVAQDALIDGLRRAEQDFGIIGRLIPSIDRSLSPERAFEMVSDVVASPSPFTLGIGIDYLETDGLPESFWKAFKLAHENGLRCTAHAGEDGSHPRSVETCLDLLHCSRIDHGYTVLEDEALTQRCLDEGIVFTVVPSNSHYCEVLEGQDWSVVHPIRHMMDRGLKLTIGSDDPPLHFTDPAWCYVVMVNEFGATLDDVRGFIANSIDGSWAPEAEKQRWRAEWLEEFDTLRNSLNKQDL